MFSIKIQNKPLLAAITAFQLRDKLRQPNGTSLTKPWLVDRMKLLGPTYMKIGQFIASRSDLYDSDIVECFRSMNDDMTPLSEVDAMTLMQQTIDLSKFKRIDMDAAHTASIAQVHRGQLMDGRDVVIKIMRPRVKEDIEEDMKFWNSIVNLIDAAANRMKMSPDVRMATKQAVLSMQDLQVYLFEETDFQNEMRNMQHFEMIYKGDKHIRIPKVIKELSSSNAIVMEDVPSTCILAATNIKKAPWIMSTFLHQLIRFGIMHGDPHKGNIGIDADNRLVLYDFGSVIKIGTEDICHLKDLGISIMTGNSAYAIQILKRMGAEILDESMVDEYIHHYREYMRTLDIQELMRSTMKRTEGVKGVPIVIPSRISRILRSLTLIEGLCKEIDPDFSYVTAVAPTISLFIEDKSFFDVSFMMYKFQYDMRSTMDRWSV